MSFIDPSWIKARSGNILLFLFVLVFSLLIMSGCVLSSQREYYGRTLFIPLKSSPSGAAILLDGERMGYTPSTVTFTYLHDPAEGHTDENRQRILTIEKKGYESFQMSFSVTGKEYEKIQTPIILKKRKNDKKQKVAEKETYLQSAGFSDSEDKYQITVKEIEKLRSEVSTLRQENDRLRFEKMEQIAEQPLETIYTIQVGSFVKAERAQRHYEDVISLLQGAPPAYLRIEKIGQFYSIRIGKYDKYELARNDFELMKSNFPSAIIMKAFMKEDRIVKLHESREHVPIIDDNNDLMDEYFSGLEHGSAGRHREAIAEFKKVIIKDPLFPDAHYNMGVAYEKLGMYEEALELYKKTVKIAPGYTDAQFNIGVIYHNQGMFQESVRAFQKALKLNPHNSETYINIGISYGKSGEYKKSINALKKAISVDPDNPDAHYNLGFAYLKINDINSAWTEYDILTDLDANSAHRLQREIDY